MRLFSCLLSALLSHPYSQEGRHVSPREEGPRASPPQAHEIPPRRGESDPLIAIAGVGGVTLRNSMGNAWTADYLKITGELDADLLSNIAAEASTEIVYERLINFTDNAETKDALQFVMTAKSHT